MAHESCPKCGTTTTVDRASFWAQRKGMRIAIAVGLGLPAIGVIALFFPKFEAPWDSISMGVVGGLVAGVAWEAVPRLIARGGGISVCPKCGWRA